MLPIDEHAKDGGCHLVSGEGWDEPTLARWCADLPGWVDQGGMSLPIQPTHYVPMPWLMHAGAMREALRRAMFKGMTEKPAWRDNTRALLAATEWPKEG